MRFFKFFIVFISIYFTACSEREGYSYNVSSSIASEESSETTSSSEISVVSSNISQSNSSISSSFSSNMESSTSSFSDSSVTSLSLSSDNNESGQGVSSDDNSSENNVTLIIRVSDDYIIGAEVTIGGISYTNIGDKPGEYEFDQILDGERKATHGISDANANGVADMGEAYAPTLSAPDGYNNINPFTTLLATRTIQELQLAYPIAMSVRDNFDFDVVQVGANDGMLDFVKEVADAAMIIAFLEIGFDEFASSSLSNLASSSSLSETNTGVLPALERGILPGDNASSSISVSTSVPTFSSSSVSSFIVVSSNSSDVSSSSLDSINSSDSSSISSSTQSFSSSMPLTLSSVRVQIQSANSKEEVYQVINDAYRDLFGSYNE